MFFIVFLLLFVLCCCCFCLLFFVCVFKPIVLRYYNAVIVVHICINKQCHVALSVFGGGGGGYLRVLRNILGVYDLALRGVTWGWVNISLLLFILSVTDSKL